MKFVIDREELMKKTQVIADVTSLKTPLALLTNIYMNFNVKTKTLELEGQNAEFGIKTSMTFSSDEIFETPEGILFNAKKISDTLSHFNSKTIQFEILENKECVLSTNEDKRIQYKIKGYPVEGYPKITEEVGDNAYVKIQESDLKEMIDLVEYIPNANDNVSRYRFLGVYMELEDGDKLSFTATDGKRLGKVERKCKEVKGDVEFNVILPVTFLKTLKKWLTSEGEATIYRVENKVYVIAGGIMYMTNLLDGVFPKYKDIIPKEEEYTIIAPKEELKIQVGNVNIMSDDEIQKIQYKISENMMYISARSLQYGEAQSALEIKREGKTDELVFSLGYKSMIDFLKAIKSMFVRISIPNDSIRTLVLKTGEDDNFIYITTTIQE